MILYCVDATATASGSAHQPHNPSTSSSSIPEPDAGQVSVKIHSMIKIYVSTVIVIKFFYRIEGLVWLWEPHFSTLHLSQCRAREHQVYMVCVWEGGGSEGMTKTS
jgi:hypothetical protein